MSVPSLSLNDSAQMQRQSRAKSHKPLVRRRHTVFPYGALSTLEKSDEISRVLAGNALPTFMAHESGRLHSISNDSSVKEQRPSSSWLQRADNFDCGEIDDMMMTIPSRSRRSCMTVTVDDDDDDEHPTFANLLGTPDFTLYVGEDQNTSSRDAEDSESSFNCDNVAATGGNITVACEVVNEER